MPLGFFICKVFCVDYCITIYLNKIQFFKLVVYLKYRALEFNDLIIGPESETTLGIPDYKYNIWII